MDNDQVVNSRSVCTLRSHGRKGFLKGQFYTVYGIHFDYSRKAFSICFSMSMSLYTSSEKEALLSSFPNTKIPL